jgi:hypothetical protein
MLGVPQPLCFRASNGNCGEEQVMPITTRPAKSGAKKVFKQKRTNTRGPLNAGAREISRSQARHLSPGALPEVFDGKARRASNKKQQAILENRRRRH